MEMQLNLFETDGRNPTKEEVIENILEIAQLSKKIREKPRIDFNDPDSCRLNDLSRKYNICPCALERELGTICHYERTREADEEGISERYALELSSELSSEDIRDLAEYTATFIDRF